MLSVVGLAFVVSGCGQDYQGRVACSDAKSCVSLAGSLFDDASAPDKLPECCGGFCVAQGGGCESGYRYISNDPAFADCVEAPMCPARDLSMPQETGDMSTTD